MKENVSLMMLDLDKTMCLLPQMKARNGETPQVKLETEQHDCYSSKIFSFFLFLAGGVVVLLHAHWHVFEANAIKEHVSN